MSDISPENGQTACNLIKERLKLMFPEMTFNVTPQNGMLALPLLLPGTIRIYGQRTKNLRYDRGNFYASFDIAGQAYEEAGIGAGADLLLKSAMADLEAQLRMRNQ